mmetsp:Transcript_7091/g.22148  ORF Transcript_7091/g.22148 Transcript_7091/m.22148 type:complete len:437 (-) Transcript_7091:14-1324(-)
MSYGCSDLDQAMFSSVPEESDGWRHSTSFSGDFYREPDNVVRGVSMAQAPLDVPGTSSFKGFVDGDFYREPDDILKGMSMSADGETSLYPGSLDFPECLGKVPDCLSKIESSFSITNEQISYILPCAERFLETDTPPSAPSDPFFNFEITTVYVSSTRPYDIGNALLDFLGMKVVSSITKISRKKFTIKADVFVENVMCTLKIRVYHQEQGTYAIEFQRRSGDCVTFNTAYQQATKYLLPRFTAVKNVPEATTYPFPRCKAGKNLLEGEILPLLDMAGLIDLPSLQAESATALADMAQDNQAVATLCNTRAFEEFKKLLQTDQTDVAYPTARMLLLLAQCPEAVPCFADEALLSMMLDKVQSKATSALVQHQLAEVVNAAISRCAATLSEKVCEDVMSALNGAIKVLEVGDVPAYRRLQEAQLTLKSQGSGASGWA